jgi:inner membrane protein
MMTITHLVSGALSVAILTQSPQPETLLIGALAALFPDIDISTSPVGRVLFPIARFLEKHLTHRGATHSLAASWVVAVLSYGVYWKFHYAPPAWIHAFNIGYFFGWFIDCFTKSGVEMFFPIKVRCVCPGNRKLRFSTGSRAEYFLLVFIVALFLSVLQINSNGGLMTEFNRLIAAPSGVEELYNEKGGRNLIVASIEGVYAADRVSVRGEFPVIAASGSGFIVMGQKGEIYQAGTSSGSDIITQRITGRVDRPAIVEVEVVNFSDEDLKKLDKYQGKQVYITGSLTVDEPEVIAIKQNPREHQSIKLSGDTISLEFAPLLKVTNLLSEQYVSGNLSVRTLNVQ